ncbi:hypothetical protein [Phytohabitans kaempferiae]|uniref:Uncharacterized protein n=1 Tax=Phytohabitans kaempferiae TaxID=1620943 RepID=A0ABV6LYU9_9ACTN
MIDSEAIRTAFAALADQAPPPDRIRAALAARVRQHHRRRLVLRLAGAGVVAASTGVATAGVWRATRPSGPGFPVLDGGPGGGWLDVPLQYRPAWLPQRYGESARTVVVDGERAPVISRDWQPGPAEQPISLLVGWHPSLDADRPGGTPENVEVNGAPGELVQVDADRFATYVTWRAPGQPQLMVSVLTDDGADAQRDLAMRVARSVRPDPGRIGVGPRFGWRPADMATTPWRLRHGFQDTDWVQDVVVNGTGGRQLLISIGAGAATKFENTTVATEPIRIREWKGWRIPEMNQLFLTLPAGVEVFAQLDSGPAGEQTMSALTRVVEEFDFGPWPDMSWVGNR